MDKWAAAAVVEEVTEEMDHKVVIEVVVVEMFTKEATVTIAASPAILHVSVSTHPPSHKISKASHTKLRVWKPISIGSQTSKSICRRQ